MLGILSCIAAAVTKRATSSLGFELVDAITLIACTSEGVGVYPSPLHERIRLVAFSIS